LKIKGDEPARGKTSCYYIIYCISYTIIYIIGIPKLLLYILKIFNFSLGISQYFQRNDSFIHYIEINRNKDLSPRTRGRSPVRKAETSSDA